MASFSNRNFSEMKNGFFSNHHETNNSYVLRSASKKNVTKKQGVYSKFLNRTNLATSLKQNETVNSKIDRLQTSKRLFKGNESFNQRGNNADNNTTREQPGPSRQWSPNRNDDNRDQAGPSRRRSPNRNEDIRNQPGPSRRRSPDEDIRNQPGPSRRRSPIEDIRFRERVQSPPPPPVWTSPARSVHETSVRDSGYSSVKRKSPERIGGYTSLGNVMNDPSLSPRVVLKRYEPEFDEFGRPIGLKRDKEGFLIPPAPTNRGCTEEKRIVKKCLSELTDSLNSANAFYILKRWEDLLSTTIERGFVPFNGFNPPVDQERKLQVFNWLKSATDNNEPSLPVPPSVISAIPREVLQDYAASVISYNPRPQPQPTNQQWPRETSAAFSLRDWSLVKGKAPIEVMVTGDLMDVTNETLIEEAHVSSRVLVADTYVVRTSCCVYHLNGDFVDRSGSIPPSVKKYFEGGKFPKEWREVIRMWSILNEKESGRTFVNEKSRFYDTTIQERDNVRRIVERDDEPVRERDDPRVQDRNDTRIRERDDTRIRERNDTRALERDDTRIRERNDTRALERDDTRIRERNDTRALERDDTCIRERNDTRALERDDTRIRERNDTRALERDDTRIRERNDTRALERDDTRIRERNDTRIRERDIGVVRLIDSVATLRQRYDEGASDSDDERVRGRDEIWRREDGRIRQRVDDRILERNKTLNDRHNHRNESKIRDREEDRRTLERDSQRFREREDQRIHQREEQMNRQREEQQRIRLREEQRTREVEVQRVSEDEDETPVRDTQHARERNERDRENPDADRIRARNIARMKAVNKERFQPIQDRSKMSESILGRKRKSTNHLEEEEAALARDNKRIRLEMAKKRVGTPISGISRRNSMVLTRSAARRRKMDSYLCTPKSSKRATLKSRRKTPMPPRGKRIIDCESVASDSFANSDLM